MPSGHLGIASVQHESGGGLALAKLLVLLRPVIKTG